jgi:purine-binding chemotaxis protein CheW
MSATQKDAHRTLGQGAELLSVRIGDQDFALDIMAVREIRGWIASTPLPHAPGFIKGMINLRGVILAIVDLAERLGLPTREPDSSSVVVVVEACGRIIGLVVDAVSDIITVTDDMVQSPPDVGSGTASLIPGVLTLEGRIVSIIAIPAIVDQSWETMPQAA